MQRRSAVLLLGALAVPVASTAAEVPAAQREALGKTVSIPVKGMACSSCATRVKKTLSALPSVTGVEVSSPKARARVSYVPGKVSPERLRAAVTELGFEAGSPTPEK